MAYGLPVVGSVSGILGFVLYSLTVVFVIALGSYVGTLWALEVYNSDKGSVFLRRNK